MQTGSSLKPSEEHDLRPLRNDELDSVTGASTSEGTWDLGFGISLTHAEGFWMVKVTTTKDGWTSTQKTITRA